MSTVLKIPCSIKRIYKHTTTIMTLELLPQKRLPKCNPGQFLHFAIDPYDPSSAWPESRVFSIANYPPIDNLIRITFTVKGSYTARMYNSLSTNDTVWIKLPYGDFTLAQESAEVVLIAGGTGITPFISYLEAMSYNDTHYNITLYYGVKNAESLLYSEFLLKLHAEHGRFKLKMFIEDDDNNGMFSRGRLDIESIYAESETNENVHYYISGPPEMIVYFKENLVAKGVCDGRIHIDEWF